MEVDESGWKWIEVDESGWKWMKVDESGWVWMKVDESGWKLMKVDEIGWKESEGKSTKVDEKGWKWIKVDESGWKWMTMDESEWKWIKVGESELESWGDSISYGYYPSIPFTFWFKFFKAFYSDLKHTKMDWDSPRLTVTGSIAGLRRAWLYRWPQKSRRAKHILAVADSRTFSRTLAKSKSGNASTVCVSWKGH